MKLTNKYTNKWDKTKAMQEKNNNIVEAGKSIPDEMLDGVVGGLTWPVIEEDIDWFQIK